MNWKKRKKRNKIMKHYGFYVYTQYEIYLRIMNLAQRYKDENWFTEKDRIMIAEYMVMQSYREKWESKLDKSKVKTDMGGNEL